MKKLFVSMAATIVVAGCAVGPQHAYRPSTLGSPSSFMEWAKSVPGADRRYHEREASCRWDYYGRDCRARERAGSSSRQYDNRRYNRRHRYYRY